MTDFAKFCENFSVSLRAKAPALLRRRERFQTTKISPSASHLGLRRRHMPHGTYRSASSQVWGTVTIIIGDGSEPEWPKSRKFCLSQSRFRSFPSPQRVPSIDDGAQRLPRRIDRSAVGFISGQRLAGLIFGLLSALLAELLFFGELEGLGPPSVLLSALP